MIDGNSSTPRLNAVVLIEDDRIVAVGDRSIMAKIEQACQQNLDDNVQDSDLKRRLTPDYAVACKRLIMSGDFYDAIQRPNAKLVTSGIEGMEKAGVRTSDGELHELDVLIFATGFRVDRFMRPMEVLGTWLTELPRIWRTPSATPFIPWM